MPAPALVMQTTYAELLERSASAAFSAFSADGAFTSKTIKGRRYWYFQLPSSEGRVQKYVGPETPELLERITRHGEARDDERERRALVSTLVRSFGLPRPIPEIGTVLAALARAGVFRLRGVLVGTTAYQSYSAMLGLKLPAATLQTGDVDIAQFKNVSAAINDRTPPALELLRGVDKSFRAVPHIHDQRRTTSYLARRGLRVDFLTPNEGPDTDAPQRLPALQTDAQPLRFLDYLIHEPEPAVVLHDAGIYVLVPAPERYAIHKLIVSRRRQQGTAKREKDVRQAEALLTMLAERRPHELRAAWEEAFERGETWRELLTEGMGQLAPRVRDATLRVVERPRGIVPGLDLTFSDAPPRYDFDRDIVTLAAVALGRPVASAITGEALDDYFGTGGPRKAQRVEVVLENRSVIENMARTKYLRWPVDQAEAVLVVSTDVPKLLKESTAGGRLPTPGSVGRESVATRRARDKRRC